MAVLNGKYTFPKEKEGVYSEGLKELIRGCLVVKPEERWEIGELVRRTKEALGRLE